MAATMVLVSDNGGTDGTPVEVDISALNPNIKFQSLDVATVTTANPIDIPLDASTEYSRWKSLALKCTVAPSNQIDSVVFYTDGLNNLGDGVDVKIPGQVLTKNSGANVGYLVSDTANEQLTDRSDVTSTTSIFTHTSISSVAIGISETGSIIDTVGQYTNYVVLQMEVTTLADPGETPTETATIQYDES